jgi:hypothetical protein
LSRWSFEIYIVVAAIYLALALALSFSALFRLIYRVVIAKIPIAS